MKKSFTICLSLVILLTSILSVTAFATDDLLDDMNGNVDVEDNATPVTTTKPSTTSTAGGLIGDVAGSAGGEVGDFVGGIVGDVFDDEDVSEGVADKIGGIVGVFDNIDLDTGALGGIFDGIGSGGGLGGLFGTTQSQNLGDNFFDTIDPVVTTGNLPNMNNQPTVNTPINSEAGEPVDFNTTVIPYAKPTIQLNPGDKGDGVKWLQWVLIYTGCGLQGNVTGEYDDATAAAVKTFQLNYNYNPDGIATVEIIEELDKMYNNYINGVSIDPLATQGVMNTAPTPSSQGGKADKSTNTKISVIITVLVIVWIFALAAVFIIVHIKRKNITATDDVEAEKKVKNKETRKPKRAKGKSKNVRRISTENYDSTKASATLSSLADEEEAEASEPTLENTTDESNEIDFEVVDIDDSVELKSNKNDYNGFGEYDDEEAVITSSLSEMKKKAAEKQN